MNVELVWITPNAESMIAEIARVSNPDNQKNPEYTKLIKYLIKHKHWSPLEMANMCVKITTSRAIAAQILRHKSFSFQEFSQRYSEATEFEPIELRKQATKNRQSSLEVFNPMIDDMNSPFFMYDENGYMVHVQAHASEIIANTILKTSQIYTELLNAGVAKEVARMILPLTTQTTLYMSGTIRSWVHYLALRTKEDVQKEHRDIALQIQSIFNGELPIIATALAEIDNEDQRMKLLYKLLLEDQYEQITTFKKDYKIP